MEYGMAHAHAPEDRQPLLRGLGTAMATAALASVGTRIGERLAVHGQQLIENRKRPKS
ncbi:MAG TPA: hypothetical protein VFK62_07615 [Gaiellaceae bacterium]|jgi:hypothetical protein|nr:hypothetical protein [Gaiellaceae bacterium]